VHRIIQIIGVGISIGGVIVAFCMTTVHFNTVYHAQLGVAITVLIIAQVVAAFFRPHPPSENSPKKSTARIIFELFHWWNGRIVLVLAVVQLYSGIQLIGYPIITQYAIFLACILALIIFAEIFSCVNPKMKTVSWLGNCGPKSRAKEDMLVNLIETGITTN